MRICRGRNAWPVCACRSDRLAVRLHQSRETAMRCPPDGNSSLRPAQLFGDLFLSTGQYECERARPESRGELRRIAPKVKAEPRDHLTGRNDEEKRLVLRAALECYQIAHRFPVYA